jgi:hypothetical protein
MFPQHPELTHAYLTAHQAAIQREAAQTRLARTAQRTAPRPRALTLLQRLGTHLGLTTMPAALPDDAGWR